MPIPDDEMARLCSERFGQALDPERRAAMAALLDALARANLSLLGALDPRAEPGGHAALLRRARREG